MRGIPEGAPSGRGWGRLRQPRR